MATNTACANANQLSEPTILMTVDTLPRTFRIAPIEYKEHHYWLRLKPVDLLLLDSSEFFDGLFQHSRVTLAASIALARR